MDYEEFVNDLYCMIVFFKTKTGMSNSEILHNVLQDLKGVVKGEEDFSPRCTAYSEKEVEIG